MQRELCILHILDYCSTVWSPYILCTNINRIEAIQGHASRYMFNSFSHFSSVMAMLHKLSWQTMYAEAHILTQTVNVL